MFSPFCFVYKTFIHKENRHQERNSPDDVPHAYCVLGNSKWQSLGFAGQLFIKKSQKSNNYYALPVMLAIFIVPRVWIKEVEVAWTIFSLPILTWTTNVHVYIDIKVIIHLIKDFVSFLVITNLMRRLHIVQCASSTQRFRKPVIPCEHMFGLGVLFQGFGINLYWLST